MFFPAGNACGVFCAPSRQLYVSRENVADNDSGLNPVDNFVIIPADFDTTYFAKNFVENFQNIKFRCIFAKN